jgi:hypothetical protein
MTSPPAWRGFKELEHETDTTTHDCIDLLRRSFITPFDRDDIHRLITRLDDIIDFIEAPTDRLALYELVPASSAARCSATSSCARPPRSSRPCAGSRDLKKPEDAPGATAAPSARWSTRPTACCVTRSPSCSTSTAIVHGLKWKEIYESLEDATDRCQDVANVIEGVVLEHA